MCIDAPERTTNSRSSGLSDVVGTGIPITSPGTFHLVLTVAILLVCLLLLVERLFQRCQLSRIDEVFKCGDSMINLYMLSKTPSGCLCFQLSVSVTVPRVKKKLFSVSYEPFFFSTDKIETIEWQDLVPRQRTDDCLWIHILVEDFGIRRYQVTKVFPTWWSFASVSSAKSPCYFGFVGKLDTVLP